MQLDLRLVQMIRAAVEAQVRRTAMRHSLSAATATGVQVWMKLECQQVTGSFKVRGPLALRALCRDARPWITASAGNHGLGVAFAMRNLHPAPIVFVPSTSPEIKRRAIAALGAEVRVLETTSYDEAEAEARRYAASSGARFVSPFDDEVIMAGNGGSLGLEILEQLPDVAALVVPVGGGGLLSGLACVVRQLRPEAKIIGVQSENTPAMHLSLRRGSAMTRHTGPPTLAEGLEGGVSPRSYAYVKRWVDDVLLIPEVEIADAMRWLWNTHALRVEGSAAVAMAALLNRQVQLPEPVCVVLTGSNVDDETWRKVCAPGSTTL